MPALIPHIPQSFNLHRETMLNPIQILNPIRRSVRLAAHQWQELFSNAQTSSSRAHRNFKYESLEERRVLTATGFEVAQPVFESDTVQVAPAETAPQAKLLQQSSDIRSIVVAVNGELRKLTADNNQLNLNDGDRLHIVDINIDSNATTGVFAVEAYINKISDLNQRSKIDYNDGRFSTRETSLTANGDGGNISGVDEAWEVKTGWDRLTLNLMHYMEDSTEVPSRFFVNLQVGQPDFAFDIGVLDEVFKQDLQVGQEVSIPGKWMNQSEGTFHNYAEVDIFHSSAPDRFVWAGAVVGSTNGSKMVEGKFINTREADDFATYWTPTEPGEYILKYYLDPERMVAESDETNNTYELRLIVEAAPPEVQIDVQPIANGNEDGPIKLTIKTNAESVIIYGVPTGAKLNFGTQIARGVYEVKQNDLPELTIYAPKNSDVDFQVKVTPIGANGRIDDLTQVIDVVIAPVVDGGQVEIKTFGIVAGSGGTLPMNYSFVDLDGSESHRVTLDGVPDFIEFSAGKRSGAQWILTGEELKNLEIKSNYTESLSGWTRYSKEYAFRDFRVKLELQSSEFDSRELKSFYSSFVIYAWQRI